MFSAETRDIPVDTQHQNIPNNPERWIQVVIFAVTLLVYLRTLCPTIFTDDCGEIATAVATGGVIHPPGYPLYTLVGSLFIKLIPFGEPAWRLGLVSSICASLAVSGSFHLIKRVGTSTLWAVCASLAFGLSIALWQQATKVETYALNALFVVTLFNFALTYAETGTRRDLLTIAFFCGLSLTNHLTIICSLAGVAWLVIPKLVKDKKNWQMLPVALTVFVLPLSLYSLLWLNASAHPGGQIWGDPTNWHRLFLHVTGARYHVYLLSLSAGASAQRDLVNLPALLWRNIGISLVAVVPGIARMLWVERTRSLGTALLISGAAYLIETSIYGIANIFEYYTPLIFLLCTFVGVGFDAVIVGLLKRFPMPHFSVQGFGTSLGAVLVATSLIGHWNYCDHSGVYSLKNLALNTLGTLPPKSVLITIGDNRVFPMWYVQDVLHFRQDVTVISRSAVSSLDTPDNREEMSWIVEKLGHQHPDVVDAPSVLHRLATNPVYAKHQGPVWQIVSTALNQNHPVFITDIQPGDTCVRGNQAIVFTALKPDFTPVAYGLSDQIVPLKDRPDLLKRVALAKMLEQRITIDYAPEQVFLNDPDGPITNIFYALMLRRDADMLNLAGDSEGAVERMQIACKLSPSQFNDTHLAELQADLKSTRQASLPQTPLDNRGDKTREQEQMAHVLAMIPKSLRITYNLQKHIQ